MRRISIDVTPEQHQQLKALAALEGKSIKAFVLERTLGSVGGERLAALESAATSAHDDVPHPKERSIKDVFAEARRLATTLDADPTP